MSGTTNTGGWLRLMRQYVTLAALLLGLIAAPTAARAQSAIIYGALGNFDISNDTGKVCHGFEVLLDGLTPAQVPYSFSSNRYGAPVVTPTATGVAVRWATTYDPSTSMWADRTVQHTVPWFPGQCYQWTGPATYTNSGCEHFGAGAIANPTKAQSHWLCEDPAQPGVLVADYPPTAVPFANSYVVAPNVAPAPAFFVANPLQVVIPAGNPPEVVVEVEAPDPAEAPTLFGDAQWIRFFVTQLPIEVSLDQLVADNPAVVPMDPLQLEADYSIIQDEPVAGGNGKRKRHRHQGSLLPTTRSVVRRIETWEFTGAYNPLTNEALCADGLCLAPAVDEIGNMISTQMTVTLVQSDSVTVTKSGTGVGSVDSSDKRIACGSKCVAPYANGQLVKLTVKAASGSSFGGWTGACVGAGISGSCTVSANGHVDVGAIFTANPAGGGGGGGATSTTYKISISKNGKGTVASSPAAASYAAGTVVTLTATPDPGSPWVGWGGACSGIATTCTVTMNSNLSVTANFR